jgi:uncharacterized membrane protein
MQVLLVVLYPLLVHLSIVLGLPILQALALVSLAAGFCYGGLKNGNIGLWLFLVALAAVAVPLALADITLYLLYVPPVALPLLLAVVFGNTLLPGREPLVTAIGEASRGPLSAEMRSYSRHVTILWTAVFCLMAVEAFALTITGHPELWSWVTSIINYLLVGVLFLGEFLYRKKRFPDHNHPGFLEYVRIVVHSQARRR